MGGIGINDIGTSARGIGIAVLTVAILVLVLATMQPATYKNITVANLTFDNETTLTVQYGLVSWNVYNDTTQTYAALPATNYTLNTATGFLNVTDNTARGGPGTNILESVRYVYSGNSNATAILILGGSAIITISDWVGMIVVIVIAVIILGLVMMLGRNTRRKGE